MLPPDFIAYFKALVDHDPDAEHWTDWWMNHEKQIASLLDPGVYLRLRHTPFREIFSILESEGLSYPRPKRFWHPKFRVPHPVPAAWLQEKITLVELEKKLSVEMRETELAAIKQALKPGDELWEFRSPQDTWKARMGRAGFAFVREGVPYDSILILMS